MGVVSLLGAACIWAVSELPGQIWQSYQTVSMLILVAHLVYFVNLYYYCYKLDWRKQSASNKLTWIHRNLAGIAEGMWYFYMNLF